MPRSKLNSAFNRMNLLYLISACVFVTMMSVSDLFAIEVAEVSRSACKLSSTKLATLFKESSKKISNCDLSKCHPLEEGSAQARSDVTRVMRECGAFTWAEYYSFDQIYQRCTADQDKLCPEMSSRRERLFKNKCAKIEQVLRTHVIATAASCIFDNTELGELKIDYVSEASIAYRAACGLHCVASVSYLKGYPIRLRIERFGSVTTPTNIYCCQDGPLENPGWTVPATCNLGNEQNSHIDDAAKAPRELSPKINNVFEPTQTPQAVEVP